jgi:hypothetical protein
VRPDRVPVATDATTRRREIVNTHVQDWVAWLRDPANHQAEGVMKAQIDRQGTVGYCCLGGACELAGVELTADPGNTNYDHVFGIADDPRVVDDISHSYLPDWLADYLGLTTDDQESLTNLNDGTFGWRKTDFPGIADVVELASTEGTSIRDAAETLGRINHSDF